MSTSISPPEKFSVCPNLNHKVYKLCLPASAWCCGEAVACSYLNSFSCSRFVTTAHHPSADQDPNYSTSREARAGTQGRSESCFKVKASAGHPAWGWAGPLPPPADPLSWGRRGGTRLTHRSHILCSRFHRAQEHLNFLKNLTCIFGSTRRSSNSCLPTSHKFPAGVQ